MRKSLKYIYQIFHCLCYNTSIISPMRRGFFLVFILLLSYFLFVPHTLNEVNAAHCTSQRPGSAPTLTSATPQDKSVTLTWIEAQDPVTYYLVAYGTSPNVIEYGAPNVGGRGTTSFTVGELTNGVKYYFRVRAVNNCKPGKFSNKLSAVPGTQKTISQEPKLSIYKPVIGASTSAPTQEKKVALVVASSNKSSTCQSCISWQLLTGEVVLLLLYFYFANKLSFLKKSASIIIPIATYILFLRINGTCSTNDFWCKYFLQLNVIIFMLVVVICKHRYIRHKIGSLERRFQRSLNI